MMPFSRAIGLIGLGLKALMRYGHVVFPRSAPWLENLEAELFAFPGSEHDDQVDSISQALGHEIYESHSPTLAGALSPNRDRLLAAIARARAWVQDLVDGHAASFAEIAKREGKVERHIRLLTPLAFVSPRLISEIIDGSMPPDLTVTGLASGLAYSWAKQECNRPSGS